MSIAVQTEVRGRLGKQSAQEHFPVGTIRVSELLSALSYALDLIEGRPMGHSRRLCTREQSGAGFHADAPRCGDPFE